MTQEFKPGDRVVLTGVVVEADRYGGAVVKIDGRPHTPTWMPGEHLRHAEPVEQAAPSTGMASQITPMLDPYRIAALRHAEQVEPAAPWPPPSGPRQVWQSADESWTRRTDRGGVIGYATEAEALLDWHWARR